MKEQQSIPTTKTQRSAKFVKTGFQIGGNYIKHYSKKLFNPEMDRAELNEDNATDIYKSLSELKGSALKIAQMLSMDKNIMPKSYVDKFTQSQYNAPPLSGPLIVRTFTKHFGKTHQNRFTISLIRHPAMLRLLDRYMKPGWAGRSSRLRSSIRG
jgi:predicted unusual protein kinase regulating ubiquinone biosynthesis (AarF/ABC1/UbiB family)